MVQVAKEAPLAKAPLKEMLLLGSGDQNSKSQIAEQAPSAAVAAACHDLKREYVVECLRIASILASHAADSAELGFDLVGEHELHAALSHFREGARVYRELLQREGHQ